MLPRGAQPSETDGQPALKYDEPAARNQLELLAEIAAGPAAPITVSTLLDFHRRLFEGVDAKSGVAVGRFRATPARVGADVGAPADDAPAMVEAILDGVADDTNAPLPQLPIANAVIKAIAAHVDLLAVHPFADGNGRVARAMEFALLVRGGVPVSLAHELQNVYNEDRSAYLRHLRESLHGDREAFFRYALQGLNRHLDERVAADGEIGRRQLLRAGFTLVELVVVILILGILAGVAAPKLLNVVGNAEEATEKELIRRIREGIEHYYLQKVSEGAPAFPNELDEGADTACSVDSPCFDIVLKRGVTDGSWSRSDTNEYVSPSGANYSYNPATGDFIEG